MGGGVKNAPHFHGRFPCDDQIGVDLSFNIFTMPSHKWNSRIDRRGERMNQQTRLLDETKPRTFTERRNRKPDMWSRVLRYTAFLVYPLLAINLFTFMGVASEDQKVTAARQLGETSIQKISSWVHFNAFLPVMLVGIVIAVMGLILDQRRSRRRTDYSRKNQMWLLVVSMAGLIVYFLIR